MKLKNDLSTSNTMSEENKLHFKTYDATSPKTSMKQKSQNLTSMLKKNPRLFSKYLSHK